MDTIIARPESMTVSAPQRIMVVGFPRSGTTLTQALLAAHPEVFSLPETFFFERLVPLRAWGRIVGQTTSDKRARLEALASIDRRLAPGPGRAGLPRLLGRPFARRFVAALDEATVASNQQAWVEKTPSHLYRINLIEKYVPDVQVLHVVREGPPAIASLLAVTNDYPDQWDGRRSLQSCIDRWRRDIRLSVQYAGRDNHLFVAYEDLANRPTRTASAMAARLGLSADDNAVTEMMTTYSDKAGSVIESEPWKDRVYRQIGHRTSLAVERLSPTQRAQIEGQTQDEVVLMKALPLVR